MKFLKRSSNLVLLIALSLNFSSCATIVSGSTQDIFVNSDPVGAEVCLDGQFVGRTPVSVNLARKSSHTLEIEKPGYESQVLTVSPVINEMLLGNLLFGGPLGLGVDILSGASHRLIPDQLYVQLKPCP